MKPTKSKPTEYYESGAPRTWATHIRRVDLNLFRVFDAVMLHGSVRAASQVLSVTPSAVSHALHRLRQTLDDELFVPGESGMQPTQRALELAATIRGGLEKFELALKARPFVPAQAVRTFRIAASDGLTTVILPQLIQRLAKSAPNVDIRVFPANRIDVVRQLEDGHVDLILGWFDTLPERMRRYTLYQEQEAIVARIGHPLTEGELTKARLFEFPHVVVELTGTEENEACGFMNDRGVARRVWQERVLLEFQDKEIGLVGRAAVCVPHSAAVPPLIEGTDMVATLPRRLALWTVKHFRVRVLDLPYEPKTLNIEMVCDQSVKSDKGLQWLMDELAASVVA